MTDLAAAKIKCGFFLFSNPLSKYFISPAKPFEVQASNRWAPREFFSKTAKPTLEKPKSKAIC